jgi:hypothetical protein
MRNRSHPIGRATISPITSPKMNPGNDELLSHTPQPMVAGSRNVANARHGMCDGNS